MNSENEISKQNEQVDYEVTFNPQKQRIEQQENNRENGEDRAVSEGKEEEVKEEEKEEEKEGRSEREIEQIGKMGQDNEEQMEQKGEVDASGQKESVKQREQEDEKEFQSNEQGKQRQSRELRSRSEQKKTSNSKPPLHPLEQKKDKLSRIVHDLDQLIGKYNELREKAGSSEKARYEGTLEKLQEERRLLQEKLKHGMVSPSKAIKDELVEHSLFEIYTFYARQAVLSNKKMTFEKRLIEVTFLNLSKFMYFCRDFKLINLEVTMDFLTHNLDQLGVRYQLNHNARPQKIKVFGQTPKENFVVTKFYLVEVFKKVSTQDITLEEFKALLWKMADQIFRAKLDQLIIYQPVPPKLIMIHYLKLLSKSEYRKQMRFVGKVVDVRYIPTQDKSRARSKPKATVHLPQRVSFYRQQRVQSMDAQTKRASQQSAGVDWEKLSMMPSEEVIEATKFNPRELLLEDEYEDEEDKIYLSDYGIKKGSKDQSRQNWSENERGKAQYRVEAEQRGKQIETEQKVKEEQLYLKMVESQQKRVHKYAKKY